MKKVHYFFSLLLLLFACSEDKKQFEFAGGTFRMAIDSDMLAFEPALVADFYSATVLNQVFEGLVTFDPQDLNLRPQLASSYKVSADGLTYEFSLRKKVYFHPHEVFEDDDDRLLTPEDIVFSFELACTKDKDGLPSPAYTSIFQKTVAGAVAFYEGKAKSISGIRIEKNKLIVQLLEQDENFLNKLANIHAAIVSKKVVKSTGKVNWIGTGPFVFSEVFTDEHKTWKFTKNESYYLKDSKGNSLPYLDGLEFLVETKKANQLALFDAGKTDFIVSLPSSGITSVLEGRIQDFNQVPPVLELRNNPLLVSHYYFFNMQDPRFQDAKVRQAFNFAIDRSKIIQEILMGQAFSAGDHGVVPPIKSVFNGYDFNAIKTVSYTFNPELAKKLLADAGYTDGVNFGEVELKYNLGETQTAVAEEFARQIEKNLGIRVNAVGTTFDQNMQDANVLKGDLFKTSWSADYCSPETFLQAFYGKLIPKDPKAPSLINQSRYVNPAFDAYFEQAKKEKKRVNRLKNFNLAEKELMLNPPLIVLWYAGDNQLIYAKVRNLHDNPLNFFYFREVYLKDWTKEEYQNQLMK